MGSAMHTTIMNLDDFASFASKSGLDPLSGRGTSGSVPTLWGWHPRLGAWAAFQHEDVVLVASEGRVWNAQPAAARTVGGKCCQSQPRARKAKRPA